MDAASAHHAVFQALAGWTTVWIVEDTIEELGLDSLDRLDMLYQLEKEHRVNLRDLDRPDATVSELLGALETRPRLPDPVP